MTKEMSCEQSTLLPPQSVFLAIPMFTTILLVEDNELNRDMLSRRLERKGYVIQRAADGAQGVSMAMELRPALILMDLSLPVMDGWEATRRLKGNPETAAIPIIALTAHARAEDEKTARDAGANDFDTKPIDPNRLIGKIEHLLTTQATGTLPENP
jgi:two-component system response regulator